MFEDNIPDFIVYFCVFVNEFSFALLFNHHFSILLFGIVAN